jgi:pyridoxal phosphate enzyme (YggS family)
MPDRFLMEAIKDIYVRIARSAMRSGRGPEEVRLVAVTKTVSADMVRRAVEAGLREFGENRVQEAKNKVLDLASLVPDSRITWHLVGHLQKNKAKTAVGMFDLIHSVDSVEIAGALNEHAGRTDRMQSILVQVKLAPEETKHGIEKKDLFRCLDRLAGMKNLKIEGLMTIPPFFDDPEMSRPYFGQLRDMREEAENRGFMMKELSMGMTNDFEVAIEEGATIVRIGTAIFGERKREAI